ncbi:MAG: hypothetical protein EOO14_14555, partial [Chitinophagaceae bacterium]
MIDKRFCFLVIILLSTACFAGTIDSLPRSAPFTGSTTSLKLDTLAKPVKLLHAEPLYIDLIRDLGAHKG